MPSGVCCNCRQLRQLRTQSALLSTQALVSTCFSRVTSRFWDHGFSSHTSESWKWRAICHGRQESLLKAHSGYSVIKYDTDIYCEYCLRSLDDDLRHLVDFSMLEKLTFKFSQILFEEIGRTRSYWRFEYMNQFQKQKFCLFEPLSQNDFYYKAIASISNGTQLFNFLFRNFVFNCYCWTTLHWIWKHIYKLWYKNSVSDVAFIMLLLL